MEMAIRGQREVIGDSWFPSVTHYAAFFPKKKLEDIMKSWPGGKSLLIEARKLKPVNLISIGFK
jgi:tRNA A37 threonylcarbamoyladenosine synthetase subunit TsaC/SUA5/YrdC